MRLPSYSGELTKESIEGLGLLDGVWRESANLFSVRAQSRRQSNKPDPLGIQPFINEAIDRRFLEAGWDGKDSRFVKNKTWIRISFRHQMSLGSDFLDAIRLPIAEGIEQCIILGASSDFLRIISPKDWRVLCSSERMFAQAMQLEKSFNSPIIVGELSPKSELSADAKNLVYGPRISG
jgi:hypothetical protein